jgi:hypothetical protein
VSKWYYDMMEYIFKHKTDFAIDRLVIHKNFDAQIFPNPIRSAKVTKCLTQDMLIHSILSHFDINSCFCYSVNFFLLSKLDNEELRSKKSSANEGLWTILFLLYEFTMVFFFLPMTVTDFFLDLM